jgi:hypothetical protein
MAYLLVAGLASVGVFLIWFALARSVVESSQLPSDWLTYPGWYIG